METIVKAIATWAHAHPTASAWIGGAWLSAVILTNGLRFAWPKYEEMPRLARFVVGALDPLALNFWNIGKKIMPDIQGQHVMQGEPDERKP